MIIEQITLNFDSKTMDFILEKLDSLGYEKNYSGIEKFLVDFSNDETHDETPDETPDDHSKESLTQKVIDWTNENPAKAMAIKNTFLKILSKVIK